MIRFGDVLPAIEEHSASGSPASQLPTTPLKRVLLLSLGVWLMYLAFLPPGIYSIDGNSMLAVAESLVSNHNIVVPAALGTVGRNGHIYSTWYPLQSLLAVPFVALATVLSRLAHVPLHYIAAMCALVLPSLFTALTAAFVYLLAIDLGSSAVGAMIAALTYAFGTAAMAYARSFYAEPLLGLLITAALYFAFRNRSTPTGVLTALLVLAKPTAMFVGPILSLYLLARRRPFWPSLLPAVGALFGLALYSLYNFYRFENFFTFLPPLPKEYGPALKFIPAGVTGMLFSPGIGLLWFCPCVVVTVAGLRRSLKSRRLETLTFLVLFSTFLLFHASWMFWNAGWAWGPRYLVPLLPAMLAFAAVMGRQWRKALLSLGFAGFLMTAPTLVSFFERYLAEAFEQGLSYDALVWQPSHSPLLHAWPAALRQIHDARTNDVSKLFADRGAPAANIAESRALRVVAVWWWVLPIAHIPRSWGVAVSGILLITGIWMIAVAWPLRESAAGLPSAPSA